MNKDKHIPQGYKDSPLGIIPKDWEVKRLGEIVTRMQLGGNYENSSSQNGVPLIKMGNIGRGKINVSQLQYLAANAQYDKSDILKKYDLLFNTRNTMELVGKVAIWKNELPLAVYNSNLLRIEFNKNIVFSNIYANYYFNSDRSLDQLKRYATGTTSVAAIYSKDLLLFKFVLPSLDEQKHICSILQLWDTAIEKQSELIEKFKLRKRALMQQLLTGKKRLPGFSGEWKRIKLGDIAERITRKNEEDNKNVVTISAQRGFVVQTDFFNKSVASEVLDNYFLVYKDEFCYNKSYSNGYPMGAIKRLKSFDKAVVTTLYICFKLKNMASVNIDFFEQYCESGIFNKELIKVANEGGRAHGLLNVTPADFFNMHMRIPNIDEQNAIAILLVNADKEIELAKEKLSYFQSQKRGLMQQLLTGKKRIMQL